MNIRLAVEAEAELLFTLAMNAKAHWGYAKEVLEPARRGGASEVTVDADPIRPQLAFDCQAI